MDDVLLNVIGSTIAIRSEGGVDPAWRPLWSRCLRAEGVTAAPDVAVTVAVGVGDLPRAVLTRVTNEAITIGAGRLLMLHAAGVASADGRVVALVGRSGAGKTTAAIHLARRSFGYVTDETVAVEAGLRVHAFPRPLAISDGSSGRKTVRSPDDLGLNDVPPDLRLAAVVLLDRRRNHRGAAELHEVPTLDAILELVPQISALGSLESPLQMLCRIIASCGGVRRLVYEDLDTVSAALDLLVADAGPTEASWWSPTSRPQRDRTGLHLGLRDGRIRQGGALDAVWLDGEILLLVENKPIRLSGVGPTIWEAAVDAPTFDEIVERVVDEHGPHPDAESLVREAVDSMVEAKVLGYGPPVTVRQFVASMAPQLAVASDNACSGGGA